MAQGDRGWKSSSLGNAIVLTPKEIEERNQALLFDQMIGSAPGVHTKSRLNAELMPIYASHKSFKRKNITPATVVEKGFEVKKQVGFEIKDRSGFDVLTTKKPSL